MLIDLPISLAMFQDVFNAPDGAALARIILRWFHFVAGITLDRPALLFQPRKRPGPKRT